MRSYYHRTRDPRDWSPSARSSGLLPPLLFGATCVVSAGLLALVITAPLLAPAEPEAEGWGRVLVLFAHDPTVRRTAIASALGLLATACIFFREQIPEYYRRRKRRLREPPPPTIAGA